MFVNAVAPGPTLTAMSEQLPQSRKGWGDAIGVLGKNVQSDEVAAAILWLGSESPAYVNGSTLDVKLVVPAPVKAKPSNQKQDSRHVC